MTREEFMDIVYSELHSDGDNYRANRIIDAADEYAEAQTRWIPVSERLPKSKPEDLEYPTVIICLSDGTVELGCFYESTKEWGAGENFDRLRNPIAWMPLPDPYKAEGSETDDT